MIVIVYSQSEDEIPGNQPDNQSHKKSKESQQQPSSSQTRNQSNTRNNETTKENQSGITGQTSTEKSKSVAPEVTTQNKQSNQLNRQSDQLNRQSDQPNRHSNQPNRQSNQSNVASQSKQLQQCVNANSAQKETVKDKGQHSSNDTEMVDKDLRSSRSPRKHSQTKTEDHTQGKRLKVTEPTVVIAEKEGTTNVLKF